ncbi:M23 family metallopeptidase [Paraliobacillus sp. X-1268]|uniref:M23 family metallopeptidase n=1 Tax=Paraliobacillus sp. X-1268 TaxID=2213193 RepID=UPI000E3EC6C0|nr:M23 family metallopeptidase [Paraliobacillus sp. X-1268]
MKTWKNYKITSLFGYRTHPITGVKQSFHTGIDLVKSHKASIGAFTAGQVLYAGNGQSGSGLGGYGIVVLVKDSKGRGHLYAHLDSVSVKKGQTVSKGQEIGKQGATGNVTGSHLHYEVRKSTSPSYGWISDRENNCLNPTDYVDGFKEPSTASNSSSDLKIDGRWGKKTTKALQSELGTVEDSEISDQFKNDVTVMIGGVEFGNGKKGSLVVKALQKLIGAKQDGLLGPNTVGKLQKYLGTTYDKVISDPSAMVKELQRRLNAGNL